MLRRISALLALVACAVALSGAGPTDSQYVQTMTFQNGVAPTAGYSGTEATYITSAAQGTNYGAGTSLIIGTTSVLTDSAATLVAFDISSLPDSAVITQARLYLYQTGPNATVATGRFSWVRLLRDWTEGTGNDAGTTTGGGAAWDSSTAAANWAQQGALGITGAGLYAKWRAGISSSLVDSATVGGSFYGSDVISDTTVVDISYSTSETAYKRGVNAGSRFGWVVIDVTHDVRLFHGQGVSNHGWRIGAVSGAPAPAATLFTFASDDYTTDIRRRPKLEVQYIDPEEVESAGGGGSVRRTTGRVRTR